MLSHSSVSILLPFYCHFTACKHAQISRFGDLHHKYVLLSALTLIYHNKSFCRYWLTWKDLIKLISGVCQVKHHCGFCSDSRVIHFNKPVTLNINLQRLHIHNTQVFLHGILVFMNSGIFHNSYIYTHIYYRSNLLFLAILHSVQLSDFSPKSFSQTVNMCSDWLVFRCRFSLLINLPCLRKGA